MKKARSVLLITYFYPPMGGAGSPRLWHLSRGLARRGWNVTVLTVRDVSHPYPDETLENEIPPNLRVLRTESRDLLRILRRLRGHKRDPGAANIAEGGSVSARVRELARRIAIFTSFPDTRCGWIRPAFQEALRATRESPPDIMISSAPPASAHVVARRLAQETRLPWIADFRDPLPHFLYPSQYPTWLHRRRIAVLQKRVLEQAEAVIANTPSAASYFGEIVPGRTGRIATITNGFDPEDFRAPISPTGKFRLLHAGSLAAEQHPGTFLDGVERALNRRPEMADDLELVFLGDVRPRAQAQIRAFASRPGKENLVQVKPPVPHREAIREMQRAFALVLILHSGRGCETIVPSKLYEYLASGRLILGVCPPGDARRLVDRYRGGLAADYDRPDTIAEQILRAFELFKCDPLADWADKSLASDYTWEQKVTEMANLVEEVVGAQSDPHRRE